MAEPSHDLVEIVRSVLEEVFKRFERKRIDIFSRVERIVKEIKHYEKVVGYEAELAIRCRAGSACIENKVEGLIDEGHVRGEIDGIRISVAPSKLELCINVDVPKDLRSYVLVVADFKSVELRRCIIGNIPEYLGETVQMQIGGSLQFELFASKGMEYALVQLNVYARILEYMSRTEMFDKHVSGPEEAAELLVELVKKMIEQTGVGTDPRTVIENTVARWPEVIDRLPDLLDEIENIVRITTSRIAPIVGKVVRLARFLP